VILGLCQSCSLDPTIAEESSCELRQIGERLHMRAIWVIAPHPILPAESDVQAL